MSEAADLDYVVFGRNWRAPESDFAVNATNLQIVLQPWKTTTWNILKRPGRTR